MAYFSAMEPQAIKDWRKDHGIRSQGCLAEMLGLKRVTVARWETGATSPPGNMLELSLQALERRFARERSHRADV